MWYVIQVRTGKESDIETQCRKVIDNKILERSFIPCYKYKKKYHGEWHEEQRPLFPGYVFLVTEDSNGLFHALKDIIGLTRLLKNGDEIVPLMDDEIEFMKRFGREEQVVEISEGIIENNQVRITDGPLKGYEGLIRKIDRHKRKAWIEIWLCGRMQTVEVGLEITEKNKGEGLPELCDREGCISERMQKSRAM